MRRWWTVDSRWTRTRPGRACLPTALSSSLLELKCKICMSHEIRLRSYRKLQFMLSVLACKGLCLYTIVQSFSTAFRVYVLYIEFIEFIEFCTQSLCFVHTQAYLGHFLGGGQQLHPAKIQSLPAKISSCHGDHEFCQTAVPSYSAKLFC